VDFEECYQAHIETHIDGVKVNFIDLDNLINNKKTSGRHQDLADVEELEK